jgi:hypothetical protein
MAVLIATRVRSQQVPAGVFKHTTVRRLHAQTFLAHFPSAFVSIVTYI